MSSPEKAPLLGRTIAQRYRLISHLGSGSVASVYLARHVLIDRLGAIKIVHPELARDPVWRERFLREARAVNRINHPNIVEITDLGEADGLLFLVMEYVPGESLKQVLERGPMGWRRSAALGIQIASALGRAHQMGVVHRGLDASNILVVARRDGGDLAKLTDFGVAKLADAAPLTVRADAPFDFAGLGDLDARSDLFALGAVLHEATTGAPPSAALAAPTSLSPEELAPRPPDVPSFYYEVLRTLLAPEADDRPRDGFEAADLLRRALEREAPPTSSIPPSPRASWWPLLEAGIADLRSDPGGSPPARDSLPPIALIEMGPQAAPYPGPASPGGLASEPWTRAPSEAPAGPPSAHPPSGDSVRPGDSARTGVSGAALDRLASMCATALASLEESIDAAERPLDAAADAALREARKLCTTVSAVSELCASDTRTLEAVQARGRGARAELGRRLDEAARERSRALGWAGTIAERTYQVQAQRLSGEHPVPAIEAMVWEQAALEQEEDRARENAERFAAEMHACQAAIERHTERLEHEIHVVNACLEGRMGALRALSIEAWAAIEDAAARAGIPPPPRR